MPLSTKVGLGPGDIVLDWDQAPRMERGTAAMSIVAKRSPISATAEHFLHTASYCHFSVNFTSLRMCTSRDSVQFLPHDTMLAQYAQ